MQQVSRSRRNSLTLIERGDENQEEGFIIEGQIQT